MIDPPIDQLIKKAECRYALTCAVARRTRELIASDTVFDETTDKPITVACKEIYEGKLKIIRD